MDDGNVREYSMWSCLSRDALSTTAVTAEDCVLLLLMVTLFVVVVVVLAAEVIDGDVNFAES